MPVLVMHSDDDYVVPVRLGQALVDSARGRGKQDIQMVR